MQVRVLFFGVLKDIVSRSAETLDLPEGAVAADVVKHYERFVSAKNGILSSVAISINQEYSNPNTTLHAGDEIALLPPVSGGSHRALITRERIDPNALVAEIKHPEDGASVVFEGVVRNHSRGRRTLFLEYAEHRSGARGDEEIGWIILGRREETHAIALATLPAGTHRSAGVAHVRFNSSAQALASRRRRTRVALTTRR